jgi:hypothetical protein
MKLQKLISSLHQLTNWCDVGRWFNTSPKSLINSIA